MKQIPLRTHVVNPDILCTKASESDTSQVFSEPGVYTLGHHPAIIYGKLAGDYSRMLWAIKTIGFKQEVRTGAGLNRFSGAAKGGAAQGLGESRVFGYRPRVTFSAAANFCARSSAAGTHPAQHAIVEDFGRLLNSIYEQWAPEEAAYHSEQLRGVLSEWIIPGTRFTSGIINRNNPLKYHRDKGNFPGVMSCMVVFRKLCEGGYLSVPEFDARWALEDGTFFLFDGQRFIHGVTPIKRLNKQSYRYSVVYYALKAMGKCGSVDEELARARVEKREREKRRARPPREGKPGPAV